MIEFRGLAQHREFLRRDLPARRSERAEPFEQFGGCQAKRLEFFLRLRVRSVRDGFGEGDDFVEVVRFVSSSSFISGVTGMNAGAPFLRK